jgi:hypothetical protein
MNDWRYDNNAHFYLGDEREMYIKEKCKDIMDVLSMSDTLLSKYLSDLSSLYVFNCVNEDNVDNLPLEVEDAHIYLFDAYEIWKTEKDTNNSYARIFDWLKRARETCLRQLRPIPLRKYNLCMEYLESKPPTTPRQEAVPLVRPQTPIRCVLRQKERDEVFGTCELRVSSLLQELGSMCDEHEDVFRMEL